MISRHPGLACKNPVSTTSKIPGEMDWTCWILGILHGMLCLILVVTMAYMPKHLVKRSVRNQCHFGPGQASVTLIRHRDGPDGHRNRSEGGVELATRQKRHILQDISNKSWGTLKLNKSPIYKWVYADTYSGFPLAGLIGG